MVTRSKKKSVIVKEPYPPNDVVTFFIPIDIVNSQVYLFEECIKWLKKYPEVAMKACSLSREQAFYEDELVDCFVLRLIFQPIPGYPKPKTEF